MFFNCSDLHEIDIPNSVLSIQKLSFANCGVAKIDLSSSVSVIGSSSFENCSALVSVTFNSWRNVELGSYCFKGCVNLTQINLPFFLMNIPEGLFYECSKLKEVTISNEVVSIEPFSFYKSGITELIIPDNVEGIGTSFLGFGSIERISIGSNSFSRLSEDIFIGCESLNIIHLRGSKYDSKVCEALNYSGFPRSSDVVIEVEYPISSVCGRKPKYCIPTPTKPISLTPSETSKVPPSPSETTRVAPSSDSGKKMVQNWIILGSSALCFISSVVVLIIIVVVCKRSRCGSNEQDDFTFDGTPSRTAHLNTEW
jgi:hypothetical protein